MDSSSSATRDALLRRSWQDRGHDAQKPHCRIEHPMQSNDALYIPEALSMQMKFPSLCHGFTEPMALPQSAVDACFIDDTSIQSMDPEYIKGGWELFRRVRFYEAITAYTLDELLLGISYLSHSNLVSFYGKIHQDHIQRHVRRTHCFSLIRIILMLLLQALL
jgi:hypothetical protein